MEKNLQAQRLHPIERHDLARESALACMIGLAAYRGVHLNAQEILADCGDKDKLSLSDIAVAARNSGLRSEIKHVRWQQLHRLVDDFPAIASLRNGNMVIFSAVDVREGKPVAVIKDPLGDSQDFLFLDRERFEDAWTHELLILTATAAAEDSERSFGFWWFARAASSYRAELAGIWVAAFFTNLFALVTPFFLMIVVDKVISHGSNTTLTALGMGACIALIFDAAFQALKSHLLIHSAKNLDRTITLQVFSHTLGLPLRFFEQHAKGTVAQLLQQTERIRQFFTGSLVGLLTDLPFIFLFLALVWVFSPLIASVVLTSGLLLVATNLLVAPALKRNAREAFAADSAREAISVETLQGMPTIKALGIECRQRRLWAQAGVRAARARSDMQHLSSWSRLITSLIEKLTIITVVWVGATLALQGELTVGGLVALSILSRRVSGPLVQASGVLQDFQEATVALRNVAKVMDYPTETPAAGPEHLKPELKGAIEFSGVSYRYPGRDSPSLTNVQIDVPACSFVAIVGPSGSGKSTLVKLLAGLYPLQGGVIRYDGYDIRELDLPHLRKSMSVVLQDTHLFRASVRDNIASGNLQLGFEEIAHHAKQAGAHEFIVRLPHGYETPLEEGGTNLSGGQRQRVALARALARKPAILVLDEVTSSLDPESERAVMETLTRMRGKRTIVVVSHRLSVVTHADFIVVLDRGAIVGTGGHRELNADCPVYRRMWNEQTHYRSA